MLWEWVWAVATSMRPRSRRRCILTSPASVAFSWAPSTVSSVRSMMSSGQKVPGIIIQFLILLRKCGKEGRKLTLLGLLLILCRALAVRGLQRDCGGGNAISVSLDWREWDGLDVRQLQHHCSKGCPGLA